jgi:hypothetical protein
MMNLIKSRRADMQSLHWPELDWNAWNVPLYVSARGLTTSAMPYHADLLEIEFNFLTHSLDFCLSTGASLSLPLRSQSVASFYQEYRCALSMLNVDVAIDAIPVEIPNPIPFADDEVHHTYDPDPAYRFWRILSSASILFHQFSSDFLGKRSPVHFFWGSFDLAVSRFCGRRAPVRENADLITREAYSHEVISAGFWPGNGGFGAPAFYCYTAPAPTGLDRVPVQPTAAHYDSGLGEFILRYDDARSSKTPEADILSFLQSSYAAGANLAKWDRASLERHPA